MPPARLTERQNDALEFIRGYTRERGKPPTLREIGEALGMRSSNGVHKLVGALEAKGYLRREPNVSRGLVLASDEGDAFDLGGGSSLPLLGRVSSHEPEALRRRPRSWVQVDPRLLGTGVDPAACVIAVAGDDGMVGEAIRKGDLLVVEEVDRRALAAGETVVAILEEQTVARRYAFSAGRIHLRPTERSYADETFAPDDPGCHLIGRVVLVIRRMR
jgi:repressor LexA